ncbi:MAG: hypothetical protein M1378_03875 [Bacteroidetes bacterium]|jgi:hypothetical protein|nr:hypothetical protein [Bacteroidota bacterium]
MAEYCGVVQSMVRVRRDMYNLTFRVHEAGAEENNSANEARLDRTVYTAEIQMRGDGFTVIPEEKLDECMKLLDEYPDQALLGIDLYKKRIVGMIADKIFGRIRDDRTLQVRSFIEIASVEEEGRAKKDVRGGEPWRMCKALPRQ